MLRKKFAGCCDCTKRQLQSIAWSTPEIKCNSFFELYPESFTEILRLPDVEMLLVAEQPIKSRLCRYISQAKLERVLRLSRHGNDFAKLAGRLGDVSCRFANSQGEPTYLEGIGGVG